MSWEWDGLHDAIRHDYTKERQLLFRIDVFLFVPVPFLDKETDVYALEWRGFKIAILYFLIGLVASTIGAVAGLGGGVIIKPVLDLLGQYDVSTIGVLSSSTVFSMAVVSLIKAKHSGIKIKGKTSLIIAFASIFGGIIGRNLFNYLITYLQNDAFVSFLQAGILAILMIIIFMFVRFEHMIKTFEVQSNLLISSAGLGLGVLSSFLGIGGGPLNIAILRFMFSMNAKDTMINSIFIIFFSQLSNLLTIGFTTGFGSYDMSMVGYMIIGGILGGFLGIILADKYSDRQIEAIFSTLLNVILFVNIYNMIRYFI